jgi:hypothetical protein
MEWIQDEESGTSRYGGKDGFGNGKPLPNPIINYQL